MTRRGRKPTGTNLLEHLQGSEHAKGRLKAILETLSGQRSIPEVCEELGIRESMFHRVRSEVLQTALDRLEPRPLGRPPLPASPQDLRAAELEAENLRLQLELKAAEVRRELAEKLPRLAKPQNIDPACGAGEKNDCAVAEAPSQAIATKHEPPPAMNPNTCRSLKRGWPAQQPRREAEREARVHARGLRPLGHAARGAAGRWRPEQLGLAPGTLAFWKHRWHDGSPGGPSPGPSLPSQRPATAQPGHRFHALVGPGVSAAAVQATFPALARREAENLRDRFRRLWKLDHPRAIHVLHWHHPGAVWAMDHSEPGTKH